MGRQRAITSTNNWLVVCIVGAPRRSRLLANSKNPAFSPRRLRSSVILWFSPKHMYHESITFVSAHICTENRLISYQRLTCLPCNQRRSAPSWNADEKTNQGHKGFPSILSNSDIRDLRIACEWYVRGNKYPTRKNPTQTAGTDEIAADQITRVRNRVSEGTKRPCHLHLNSR